MSTDLSDRIALNGPTMGTRWSAVFHAHGAPDPTVTAALQAEVDAVDASMSTWKPDSDLMQLNRMPPGIWFAAPAPLCAVVALGLQIGEASGGAFDIAVGDAVEAWGFGAARRQPDPAAIALLTPTQRARGHIEVDLATSRLRRTGSAQLDLSGIAKGYGVDLLAEVLIRRGIDSFIVSIDGDLRARGTRPDGTGWVVGLERPDRQQRALARTLAVSDVAIATSGDYRHWHAYGDTTVSHTIDPHTGAPLCNSVCAVTVTAEHCAVADAWATALMVAGADAGPILARDHGLDALFTVRLDGELHEIAVGAFAPA
ncbi:MAG: FAD:protein FMN transferase [Cypionkella sp.]